APRAAGPSTRMHSVSLFSLRVTTAPGSGATPRPGSHPTQPQSSAVAMAINGTTAGRHLSYDPAPTRSSRRDRRSGTKTAPRCGSGGHSFETIPCVLRVLGVATGSTGGEEVRDARDDLVRYGRRQRHRRLEAGKRRRRDV